MEEVNIHLHEKPQEEEMGLGKDEASSQSKHVDCLSSDDESEQGGTGGIFPQLCLDADGNMIPDETRLVSNIMKLRLSCVLLNFEIFFSSSLWTLRPPRRRMRLPTPLLWLKVTPE